MAVLATKTVPSCKLCRHERRTEIDALLERRSLRQKDDQGQTINAEYVFSVLREWGVENPNQDNLKIHWKKHCEVVSEKEVEDVEKALDALQTEMLAIIEASDGTVDGDLHAIRKLGMQRIKQRILQGQDPGVSLDHLLKADAELTKRQDNESKHALLSELTGGITAALAQPKPPKQIESAYEVIEQEAVEA